MKKLILSTFFIVVSLGFIATHGMQTGDNQNLHKQKRQLTYDERDSLNDIIKTYSVDAFKKYMKDNNIPADAIVKSKFSPSLLWDVLYVLRDTGGMSKEANPQQYKPLLSMVEFLLDTGADVNQPDIFRSNFTPLVYAIFYNYNRPYFKDLLKLLLSQKNIDLNVQNPKYGDRTALHSAVFKRDPETIELLLQAGADQTIKSDQTTGAETPLELAQALLEREHKNQLRQQQNNQKVNTSGQIMLEKIIDLLKNPPTTKEQKFKETIFHKTPKVHDIHYNYQRYFDE